MITLEDERSCSVLHVAIPPESDSRIIVLADSLEVVLLEYDGADARVRLKCRQSLSLGVAGSTAITHNSSTAIAHR